MSPTLGLARDYSRFVITFFDLISVSTSHIYISALPLSPRTSMVREVYIRYARPLARVVHGFPTSWEPVVATAYHKDFGGKATWSPCNRFIAVTKSGAVEIRDAVTLNPLSTFESRLNSDIRQLSFSPDGRLLSQFNDGALVTWDIQTGGSLGTIFLEGLEASHPDFSSTYSMDGKMLAAVYSDEPWKNTNTSIVTHDLSSMRTHLHRVSEGRIITPIWTHGEFLRFATVKLGRITISEVKFTLAGAPEVVETLPALDKMTDTGTPEFFVLLPTLSRLAISSQGTLLVCDARDSKLLLKISAHFTYGVSFSSNGRFLVSINSQGIHVWKESPTGYTPHQKLTLAASTGRTELLLSPDGASILTSLDSTIHLWHTNDSILPPSDSTPAMDERDFILGFSPNEASVAFARGGGNTVVLLDLQSGDPRLEIDTGMEVNLLRVTESTVVVVGNEKIVTWNPGTGNTRANINDCVRITTFDPLPSSDYGGPFMFELPDPNRIGVLNPVRRWDAYDMSTGRYLPSTGALRSLSVLDKFEIIDISEDTEIPEFVPIWGVRSRNSSADRLEIAEDGESCTTDSQPPGRFSHGRKVTDDGWILSPAQKRLLWLPHRWRSGEGRVTWSRRFLALAQRELPEVVILELFD